MEDTYYEPKTPLDFLKESVRKKYNAFMTSHHCKNREIAKTYQTFLVSKTMDEAKKCEMKLDMYVKHAPEWKLLLPMMVTAANGEITFKKPVKKVKTLEEEMAELQHEWDALSGEIRLWLISRRYAQLSKEFQKYTAFIDYYRSNRRDMKKEIESWYNSFAGFYDTNDYYQKHALADYQMLLSEIMSN
jgi:hypothetical protein